MKKIQTNIPDVLEIQPTLFKDPRGYFFEAYHQNKFKELGIHDTFVQDNVSVSVEHTIRGIHLQAAPHAQAKLVQVLEGRIFDIAVDLRPNSKTFKQWIGVELSDTKGNMLYIPQGFGHAFYVKSKIAKIHYKCNDFYAPQSERTLRYDDPEIGIQWPIPKGATPVLSEKDLAGVGFNTFFNG